MYVSILFLFILMLIDIRISELQNNNNNSLLLAVIIAITFSYSIFQILPYSIAVLNNYYINYNHIIYNLSFNNLKFQYLTIDNYKNNEIFYTNSNDWNGNLIDTNHISNIGNVLYTYYNIWLIITSFILLLAMVGAIVITIKQK